jgi:hypothetical protein
LLVTSKKVGLDVNIDETKYMMMSRDQSAGQNHNSPFESVEEFKYLGTTQAKQKSIQE